jgi:uncharacterized protein (DUF1330 family)
MTVYALAQLSMKDRIAYERYQARFMGVFNPFRGKVLLLLGVSQSAEVRGR